MKPLLHNTIKATLITSIMLSHVFAKTSYKESQYVRSVQEAGLIALQASLNDQITNDNTYYLAGEFTTQVQSSPIPFSAGVGRLFSTDEEASAFTTASVMNIIGQIYIDFPELHNISIIKQIPKSLELGAKSFVRYSNRNAFNFYPPHTTENNTTVRRPISMKVLPFWNGFTNIPNDADTTSVTNSALLLEAKINSKHYTISQDTLKLFEKHRDTDRTSHYYNKRYNQKNTGAFLTWLFDENSPNMPRFFFASAEKGERIPFNKNDVDCIVNANVIKMFSLSQVDDATQLPGITEACEMLNTVITQNKEYACGIYYPNTYNLSFILSLIEKTNAFRKSKGQNELQCLSVESKKRITDKIMSQQYKDGYWKNINNLHSDRIISTGFALYTLQSILSSQVTTESEQASLKEAQTLAAKYLLTQLQVNSDGTKSWKAENFFTATALVRSLVMWKSKGYTNGIISAVLLNYAKQYPEMSIEDILSYHPQQENRLNAEPEIYDQFDR